MPGFYLNPSVNDITKETDYQLINGYRLPKNQVSQPLSGKVSCKPDFIAQEQNYKLNLLSSFDQTKLEKEQSSAMWLKIQSRSSIQYRLGNVGLSCDAVVVQHGVGHRQHVPKGQKCAAVVPWNTVLLRHIFGCTSIVYLSYLLVP